MITSTMTVRTSREDHDERDDGNEMMKMGDEFQELNNAIRWKDGKKKKSQ